MRSRITSWFVAASRRPAALLIGVAALLVAHPVVRADESASIAGLIAKLRVQEAPQPVRERAQWRAPRKVVLLAFGSRGWEGRQEAFAAVAPRAKVIVAKDIASATTPPAHPAVLVCFNPQI